MAKLQWEKIGTLGFQLVPRDRVGRFVAGWLKPTGDQQNVFANRIFLASASRIPPILGDKIGGVGWSLVQGFFFTALDFAR